GQALMPVAPIRKLLAPFRKESISDTRGLATIGGAFTVGARPKDVQKATYDIPPMQPRSETAVMPKLVTMDVTLPRAEIKAPIEAINSDLSPTDEERIKKTLPGFKLITVPKTDHFLMMDAADRFNPILIQEIDALAGRT